MHIPAHAADTTDLPPAAAGGRPDPALLDHASGVVRDWARSVLYGEQDPPSGQSVQLACGKRGVVGKRVGKGGFGEVWTLRAEGLPSAVLKLTRRGAGEPERFEAACGRMENERRILAELDLPGVPGLLGHGRLGDEPFIVLRQIEGCTLRSLLQHAKGRRDALPALIGLMAQTASVLAAIHEEGVVHGDIKPDNILIGRYDGTEMRAWVIDFGLSRRTGGHTTRLTVSGQTIGTHGFLDPRHIGDAAQRDAHGDIYALGSTLFEAISGEPLFTSAAWLELLRQKGEVPESTYAALCDGIIRRRVAGCVQQSSMAALLLAMLQSDARNRPTAAQAARTLGNMGGRLVRHVPGSGHGAGDILDMMTKPAAVKRFRLPLALSAGALLSVGAAILLRPGGDGTTPTDEHAAAALPEKRRPSAPAFTQPEKALPRRMELAGGKLTLSGGSEPGVEARIDDAPVFTGAAGNMRPLALDHARQKSVLRWADITGEAGKGWFLYDTERSLLLETPAGCIVADRRTKLADILTRTQLRSSPVASDLIRAMGTCHRLHGDADDDALEAARHNLDVQRRAIGLPKRKQ